MLILISERRNTILKRQQTTRRNFVKSSSIRFSYYVEGYV